MYYNLIFFVIVYFFYISKKHSVKKNLFFFSYIILFLFLFTGLRNVGGDFVGYEKMFNNYLFSDIYFDQYITDTQNDIKSIYPGSYYILSYFGDFFSNTNDFILILTLIFFIFFYYTSLKINFNFNTKQTPWLILISFYPVIIIICVMGFTRQAIAISLIFSVFYFYINQSFAKMLLCLILAVMFHPTSIIFFGLLFVIKSKNKYQFVIKILFLISFILIIFFFYSRFMVMVEHYLLKDYLVSKGIWFKAGPIYISSILILCLYLLNKKKKLFITSKDQSFIKLTLILSVIFIFLFTVFFLVFEKSTLVDRLSYYFIPIQIFCYYLLIKSFPNQIKIFNFFTILAYFIQLNIFLYYSPNSFAWFPYQ